MKINPLIILRKNNILVPDYIRKSNLFKKYFKLVFFYINKLNYYFIKDNTNVSILAIEIYQNINFIISQSEEIINFDKQTKSFCTLINNLLSFDDVYNLLEKIYYYYNLEYKNQNNIDSQNIIIDIDLYQEIKLEQSNIFYEIKNIIEKNFSCDISWFIQKFNKYKALFKNEIFR